MNYEELFVKYQTLLNENMILKNEIKRLKDLLNKSPQIMDVIDKADNTTSKLESSEQYTDIEKSFTNINNYSQAYDKIKLFISIFKGREDIYAIRWHNKKGASGYMPVCLNAWKHGVCGKPKAKCAQCSQRSFAILDKKVIEDHLRGNSVVGIYPLFSDETCYFLAIDFDNDGWRKDVLVLRDLCKEFKISVAIERSRSGNGAHACFFLKIE